MRVLWIVILSAWQMNRSEQRQRQRGERNKSARWTGVRKQTALWVYGSWEMLIKSDLESPHSCFTSGFILETPQASPYYHNLPGKTGNELYRVWGRKQKYISLWSWEKVSLTIQGVFCVSKVCIRRKPYGRFSTTLITSSCGTHRVRIYLE